MSLAIMLIVIYLYIPNSFRNALLLALCATAGFLALALRLGHMAAPDVVTMTMLLVLANAFGALAARRFNVVSREEYRAHAKLQFAAERDHLTGCFNRRYLQEKLMDVELLRAQRFGHSLSVVICDIDNFKRINDTYGHADGDAVIRAFAGLLNQNTREGVDSVVRYGGEEFLLILPETDLAGAAVVRTTASFGVAGVDAAQRGGNTVRDLISIADKLMYEAKRAGRNCVRAATLY
jgi:PleD family two-component response regulator